VGSKDHIDNFIQKIMGEAQKKQGESMGEEIAEKEEHRKQIGGLLMNELQRLKEGITENPDENCVKCRRTRRKLCKKHKKMMQGLDMLGGKIAREYIDKDEVWKEEAEQPNDF